MARHAGVVQVEGPRGVHLQPAPQPGPEPWALAPCQLARLQESRTSAAVVLSTIHQVKGQEEELVQLAEDLPAVAAILASVRRLGCCKLPVEQRALGPAVQGLGCCKLACGGSGIGAIRFAGG